MSAPASPDSKRQKPTTDDNDNTVVNSTTTENVSNSAEPTQQQQLQNLNKDNEESKQNTDESKPKRRRKRKSGWDKPPEIPDNVDPNLDAKAILALEAAKQLGLTPGGAGLPTDEDVQRSNQNSIYVGNLHFTLDEPEIRAAFESFGPIKEIKLQKDTMTGRSKGFCFIEFENEEAGQTAINTMNGVPIAGREIKVGRPHQGGTSNETQTPADQSGNVVGGIPMTQPVPPGQRIYVGSVGWDTSAYDVGTVFAAFGAIRRVTMMPNPETGKHKGFGFIEFEDPSAAQRALMNQIVIAGRQVKTGPATSGVISTQNMLPQFIAVNIPAAVAGQAPPPPPPQMMQPGGMYMVPAAAYAAANAAEPLEDRVSISGNQRQMLMERLERGTERPSRCCLMTDMVAPGQVDDMLEGEMRQECSKFGVVQRIVIYEDHSAGGAVKIFALFTSPQDAERCRSVMHGRWFGGRTISARLYPEDQFNAGNYSS